MTHKLSLEVRPPLASESRVSVRSILESVRRNIQALTRLPVVSVREIGQALVGRMDNLGGSILTAAGFVFVHRLSLGEQIVSNQLPSQAFLDALGSTTEKLEFLFQHCRNLENAKTIQDEESLRKTTEGLLAEIKQDLERITENLTFQEAETFKNQFVEFLGNQFSDGSARDEQLITDLAHTLYECCFNLHEARADELFPKLQGLFQRALFDPDHAEDLIVQIKEHICERMDETPDADYEEICACMDVFLYKTPQDEKSEKLKADLLSWIKEQFGM